MEASALKAPSSAVRPRLSLAAPLLRLRSDEQLVTLFRAGYDEAFRAIHDRYHQRLSAYTRQMLPRHYDAEDALQDVFVRVYTSLRASDRRVDNLRPWLYRAAHNRCVDELRRPTPPPPEILAEIRSPDQDPVTQIVERESMQRVLEHVGRLPQQQRSALLLRELGGAHYDDIAIALGTSVSAVKSLLVRARISLATSFEAGDTPCSTICEELALAHDRGARPNAIARAHLGDCARCRDFRKQLHGTSRHLKGLVPTLGPLGVLTKALGLGGTGSGASAGGGAAVGGGGGGAVGGGAVASAGILSGGHVATLITAAVVSAGGAVAIQKSVGESSGPAVKAPALSSGPASVQTGTPSAAPPALQATRASRPKVTPLASSSTASGPSAPGPATTSTTPISQPSTTGIGAVSKPRAESAVGTTTAISPIGHTAITGIEGVSAAKPPKPTPATSGTTTTSDPQTPTTSTGGGSQSGTKSAQMTTGSSSSPDSAQATSSSSSPGSATWGTASTDAVGG